MINAYSSGLSQSNAVLCLPIISTILLFCYHDNTLPVTPTITFLLTHMKTARVSFDIEVNVTDYSYASLNQDTDNDIITLRQYGPTQRIIDTLYLDNNTNYFASTYPFPYPTNDKHFKLLKIMYQAKKYKATYIIIIAATIFMTFMTMNLIILELN